MELTNAKIKYLLIISKLVETKGEARSVDIAIELGVARPSVCRMLKTLADMGLIEKQPRQTAKLTQLGQEISGCYLEQYKRIYPFFKQFANLSTFDAEECALAILGNLSRRCVDSLCVGIENITREEREIEPLNILQC